MRWSKGGGLTVWVDVDEVGEEEVATKVPLWGER